jgi:23S rRNA-/tRNA-specific pseudouridylate synthase
MTSNSVASSASSRLVRCKDDALSGSIEEQQGERPFGSSLDAGTGLHSLRWIETQQFNTDGITAFDENLTHQWKGSKLSTSEFANHVMIQADEAPVSALDAVKRVLSARRRRQPLESVTELTSEQLIGMGSVWFLPASAPRDPKSGEKPERLSAAKAASLILQEGDYLRIHHYPRRFPVCATYDWSKYLDDKSSDTNGSTKPGLLVSQNDEKGWIVVDKPAMVPVHMTVDNSQENVAACLQLAIMRTATPSSTSTTSEPPPLPPYVRTQQRLDQNTSGLLVVASSKAFAAYFAKLLSTKTEQQLDGSAVGGIHKFYRCLVCLQPPTLSSAADDDDGDGGDNDNDGAVDQPSSWSVNQAKAQLRSFVEEETVIRHYLEPSICGPKQFVEALPAEANWPECLLKIRSVGNFCALTGSQAGRDLAYALWENLDYTGSESVEERIPVDCQAVVEVEIELLTGRTHQIRGQLSAKGFSLVGDARYGGALPVNRTSGGSEKVALQCSELEFLDPDIVTKQDGSLSMDRSKRWNRFRLERAWWTPLLQQYQELTSTDGTTTASDIDLAESTSNTSATDTKPL